MAEHPDFAAKMVTFYKQDMIPPRVAAKLTYEDGLILGARAMSEEGDWLRGLLLDARVLTARHGNCAAAGRLMHVAEKGLRGLLHGAGYYLEIADGGQLRGAIARAEALVQSQREPTAAVH